MEARRKGGGCGETQGGGHGKEGEAEANGGHGKDYISDEAADEAETNGNGIAMGISRLTLVN